MEKLTLDDLAGLVNRLLDRVEVVEKRLDALTEPALNIRATIASALRDMADDIDEELVIAKHTDPNDEEEN